MATTFSNLPASSRSLVAETFAALEAAEVWAREELRHTATVRPISFAEMYDFATEGVDRDGRIRTELRRNGGMARSFVALLDRLDAHSMPALAAAAAGTIMERIDEATGTRLRLIESVAATREVHLVIETGDIAAETIKMLYVLPQGGGCATLELEADGGLIHMLLERDSEILKYLLDPSTALKLR